MYSSSKSKRAQFFSKLTSGELKGARMPKGRRTSSALTARSRDKWQDSAVSRTPEEGEEEDSLGDAGEIVTLVSNCKKDNKCDDSSLDFLEGIGYPDHWDDSEFKDGLEGIPIEEVEKDTKEVDSLMGKVGVWKEFGAGKMVLQILDDGLRLNFVGRVPVPFEEENNKSFIHNEDFGIGEIRKLLANGVIKEMIRKEVVCINPMSIASNKKGKKRLCIDLSRHMNIGCNAKKFIIKSVSKFTKTIKQGSWCWCYDLKSAFHHIRVIEKHRTFLGFGVTDWRGSQVDTGLLGERHLTRGMRNEDAGFFHPPLL